MGTKKKIIVTDVDGVLLNWEDAFDLDGTSRFQKSKRSSVHL